MRFKAGISNTRKVFTAGRDGQRQNGSLYTGDRICAIANGQKRDYAGAGNIAYAADDGDVQKTASRRYRHTAQRAYRPVSGLTNGARYEKGFAG